MNGSRFVNTMFLLDPSRTLSHSPTIGLGIFARLSLNDSVEFVRRALSMRDCSQDETSTEQTCLTGALAEGFRDEDNSGLRHSFSNALWVLILNTNRSLEQNKLAPNHFLTNLYWLLKACRLSELQKMVEHWHTLPYLKWVEHRTTFTEDEKVGINTFLWKMREDLKEEEITA